MSRKIRTTIAAAIVTLLACLAMNPAPASAYKVDGNDVNLSVWNNTPAGVDAQFCPNGHVNLGYNFNTTHDPCNLITYSTFLHRNGGQSNGFNAGRLGVILRRAHHNTLYFFVRNPVVGKPYFVVNGHTYTMVEGELRTVHVAGAIVKLHRRGDSHGKKIMIIELAK